MERQVDSTLSLREDFVAVAGGAGANSCVNT